VLSSVPRAGARANVATSARENARAGPTAPHDRPRTPPRELTLDELGDDEARLEDVGTRWKVVRCMQHGGSAREALVAAGLPVTRRRWAQKLYNRFRRTGRVLDGRWMREPARLVLTDDVQGRVLRAWNGRRKANKRAIWRMVRDAIRRRRAEAESAGQAVEHLVEPSYESVYQYLRSLPKAVQLARDEGLDAWDKHGRPFVDYDPATRPNEIWQIDHTRLDIWIRTEVAPGVWEARQVYLTAVLDVYSRAVMGYVLSTKVPDAWTTALALRAAILPEQDPQRPMCGLCGTLVPDHAKEFMAGDTRRLTNALGIHLEPTPPYYPNMKAQIERFFGTLHAFLSALVGYMPADGRSRGAAAKLIPALLTLPQLRAEIAGFLAEYHARPHAGIGDEAPAARWERTAHPALPASEEDLNVLLLKDDTVRTVTKGGIRFTMKIRVVVPCDADVTGDGEERVEVRRGRYWAPELMDYWQEEVRVRYNPEDPESVLVYHGTTGELLCEAWLMGYASSKYGPVEVKHLRVGYRKGLKERTSDYAKEVARDDRRSARAHDEAVTLARELQARLDARRDVAYDDEEAADDPRDEDAGPASAPAVRPRGPQGIGGGRARTPAGTAHAKVNSLVDLIERRARGKTA
jgi:putative transposase